MREVERPKEYESIVVHLDNYYILIGKDGVSVWDKKERKWIIDASTIDEDHYFKIGGNPHRKFNIKKIICAEEDTFDNKLKDGLRDFEE